MTTANPNTVTPESGGPAGRFEFHGDVTLRAQTMGQFQQRQPGVTLKEALMTQSPLTLTAQAVDVVIVVRP